jgi:hypothetical protein
LSEDPATRVVSTHTGAPSVGSGPHALQILTTEHWSLLSARSLGYTEAMSRASIFVAALSGAVVALALVAQATDFGDGFVAFALVLLPVVRHEPLPRPGGRPAIADRANEFVAGNSAVPRDSRRHRRHRLCRRRRHGRNRSGSGSDSARLAVWFSVASA